MKNKLRISVEIIVILFVFLSYSCKKEPELPGLTTQNVIDISYRTATSGGNVTNDGGASIVNRGLCWNTSGNPTMNDSIAEAGIGLGPYRKNITNLVPGTLYYLRAYAMNSAGIGYGFTAMYSDHRLIRVMDSLFTVSGITKRLLYF